MNEVYESIKNNRITAVAAVTQTGKVNIVRDLLGNFGVKEGKLVKLVDFQDSDLPEKLLHSLDWKDVCEFEDSVKIEDLSSEVLSLYDGAKSYDFIIINTIGKLFKNSTLARDEIMLGLYNHAKYEEMHIIIVDDMKGEESTPKSLANYEDISYYTDKYVIVSGDDIQSAKVFGKN